MFIPGLGHPFPLGRLVRSRSCIYVYIYIYMNKQREKSLAASGRVCRTSEEMKNFFRFFASSRGVVIH